GLYLRALLFAASWHTRTGELEQAWPLDLAGLAQYWSGWFPAVRAYGLYSDLERTAEQREQWFLALALSRAGIEAVAESPNRSVEAMARFRLGATATVLNLRDEAAVEFERAGELFALFSGSQTMRRYRVLSEI